MAMNHNITEYLNEEIQLTGFWNIQFGSGPLSSFNSDLEKTAVTVDPLPKATPQNVEVAVHGYPLSVPGTISYKSEVTITFVGTIKHHVGKAMKAWYDAYYAEGGGDVTGASQGWSSIFQDVTFTPRDRTGADTATIVGRKGVPVDINLGGFTDGADGGQAWNPTITIMFNYYNWE